MESEKINLALEIVNERLAKLVNKFSIEKDKNKSKELEEKIEVLQNVRDQVYVGNEEIIRKIIKKKEAGIL